KIWDEVGESDEAKDKMLILIDQECLYVYKRKVDQATKSRSHLLQALADAKLELATLLASLWEKSFDGIPEKTSGTIKEQLAPIAHALEQLWKQKDERVKEFSDVQVLDEMSERYFIHAYDQTVSNIILVYWFVIESVKLCYVIPLLLASPILWLQGMLHGDED
ncbi:65-kDa microtubule-associated protein 1-like protein, partial [Tanacetum coccineum]